MENYFELYGFPVRFELTEADVRRQYRELSRRYHPDCFATGDEESRSEALRRSAMNNDAYNTLKDEDRRMAYILKLLGTVAEGEQYNLAPAFLMEMMDLNEALDEGNTAAGESNLAAAMNDWQNEVAPLIRKFDAGDRSDALMQQLKDLYFRKKYLLRIRERIDTFAA
jgi:molecular chaperone HscB